MDTGSDCETWESKPQGFVKFKRMLFGAGSRRNSKEILPNMTRRRPKVKAKMMAKRRSDRRTSVSSVSRNMSTTLLRSYSEAIEKADAGRSYGGLKTIHVLLALCEGYPLVKDH